MLPARNRMKRSAEFGETVKYGIRLAQPDLVVHFLRTSDGDDGKAPHVGLIIAKSVGSAVERHRVARRLRHVARGLLTELHESDRVVIRALPGSRDASSTRLGQQLRRGVRRASQPAGTNR